PVSREKHANRARVGTGQIGSARPRATATARNIDYSSHTDSAMDTAEIRKTTSLRKSEFINKTLAGSHACGAVRVIRRTKLPIRYAGRGVATGDTVAALRPGPPHRVAHRDVDCVRHKHIAALPHRNIENLTRGRGHAAHDRPPALIHNPQRRRAGSLR